MSAILYPVAANAEQALSRPLARAARQSEAQKRTGGAVVFATDPAGPAFATRAAALDAYAGRLDDERSGAQPPAEDRYCQLIEQAVEGSARLGPVAATYADGRRWPEPAAAARTVWRLTVSYWRVASAERPLDAPQARKARRSSQPLDAQALRAIAGTPLRPVKPQQPLDIGLFEVRPPEAPHILMPDE